MKGEPKGPFEGIRWFCKDGTVLPPKSYACRNHGGGIQHGLWSARTREMRKNGYAVGNVIGALDPADFTGSDPQLDTLAQILVERFLIQADDGWILRRARTYRGAFQAEDEEAGATALVRALLADPDWRTPARFLLLREAVRLLPIQQDAAGATEVRQLAVVIADADPGFQSLRAKIHGSPDAGDAASVRVYASGKGKASLSDKFETLATGIESLYSSAGTQETLTRLAAETQDADLAQKLGRAAEQIQGAETAARRFVVASAWMAALRKRLEETPSVEDALLLLRASLAVERESYASGNTTLTSLDQTTRADRLYWLKGGILSLYGSGLISARQRAGAEESVARLESAEPLVLQQYREEVRYMGRMAEWSGRAMAFHFDRAVVMFSALDPMAHLFPQDRLRGSPLLVVGAVVDSLVRDANHIAGIEHELFGTRAGTGLRALNPGMARGALYSPSRQGIAESVDGEGIYILPETVSDLPPVGGILTQGEGSSLSHVQLLARNLGIPNVVVGDEILDSVRQRVGKRVVMAVSPNGVVQLDEDGPRWAKVFGEEKKVQDVVIEPDLEKLDLTETKFVPLSKLRATDSGRVSGPKGANLGELKHHFGNIVPDGFVIPFGVFRALLDQPLEAGGPPVFAWMKERYATIAKLEGAERQKVVRAFLDRLRDWIQSVDPGPEFRGKLRVALEQRFGKEGSYGAFVRSDTNVEDLPGFTGAGLNLTIPNVVGFDNIAKAVQQVWSSPFTERAYRWRQAHMDQPEYVFPAVVVQYSFPAEKSGVMVTTDLESGESGWLSVAVSEGVGGAVDGQATESLRIRSKTGEVRFLSQSTAPTRAILSPHGGVKRVRATGTDAVLQPGEIAQLIEIAKDAPARFPTLRTVDGDAAPADIEFAFRDGKLALLQIRPLVESRSAQSSVYLSKLDQKFQQRGDQRVSLFQVPEVSSR